MSCRCIAWPTARSRNSAARAIAICAIDGVAAREPGLSKRRPRRAIDDARRSRLTSHAAPSAAQLTTPSIAVPAAACAPSPMRPPVIPVIVPSAPCRRRTSAKIRHLLQVACVGARPFAVGRSARRWAPAFGGVGRRASMCAQRISAASDERARYGTCRSSLKVEASATRRASGDSRRRAAGRRSRPARAIRKASKQARASGAATAQSARAACRRRARPSRRSRRQTARRSRRSGSPSERRAARRPVRARARGPPRRRRRTPPGLGARRQVPRSRADVARRPTAAGLR